MSQFVTGGGGDLDPVVQAVGQASGSELGLLGTLVQGQVVDVWFRPPGQKSIEERLRDPGYGASPE
ncbi:hypothetical protein [Amycolatopsis sp. RTGN1]|uniref:hypothetical protein n=1 Tax=Amycolatopsis ponsaeliensis TaxID=2992142 RepID=UPI002549D0EA|nr:hypothetical protein [Amycolatopsis sp. RTGN1]